MKHENKLIEVFGDKHKKAEPIHHTIAFPGGHINVTRTTDDQYWAHIWVNTEQILEDHEHSKLGEIKRIRIDTEDGVKTIEEKTNHFAVLIGTVVE